MTPDLAGPAEAGCRCFGCQALRVELGDDSGLLAHYSRRLLVRGWAGRTSPAAAAYVRAHASWAQAAARVLAARRKAADGGPPRDADDLTDLWPLRAA